MAPAGLIAAGLVKDEPGTSNVVKVPALAGALAPGAAGCPRNCKHFK